MQNSIWINNHNLTGKFYKIPFIGFKHKSYEVSFLCTGDKNIKKILTSWHRVLLQKLRACQLVRNFPYLIEPKSSLPCSKEHNTGPCPEQDESVSVSLKSILNPINRHHESTVDMMITLWTSRPLEMLHNIEYMHHITFLTSEKFWIPKHIWPQTFWIRHCGPEYILRPLFNTNQPLITEHFIILKTINKIHYLFGSHMRSIRSQILSCFLLQAIY
jgi:hypothetical protein